MTGYVTVGLIVGLGAYWVLLLACRTHERGVVVLTFAERIAQWTRAILDMPRQIGFAFGFAVREAARATVRFGEAFQRAIARAESEASAGLPDGIHAEYDQTPLLPRPARSRPSSSGSSTRASG